MNWKDKNDQTINDGDALLFTHEDIVEPSGYSKYVTNVKLCFWSENEKRYVPISELTTIGNTINDAEIVINNIKR